MSAARRRLAVSLATLVALALAVELAVRLAGPALGADARAIERTRAWVLHGAAQFEPSPHTLYRRPRASEHVNAQGFRDREWALERPPGMRRVACLGGSTTETASSGGFESAYPALLEAYLERASGEPFEVMNCGMSGWTSAELVVAWFLLVKDYRPDLVVLHLGANDVVARTWPDFRSDYSHYRRPWERPRYSALHRKLVAVSDAYAWLASRAGPPAVHDLVVRPHAGALEPLVPATAAPFARNVLTIARDARAQGAEVCLVTMPVRPSDELEDRAESRDSRRGIEEHNEVLRSLAREHGFLLVDLARAARDGGERFERAFVDLVHVTPAGNAGKAQLVADELARSWLPRLR